LIRKSWESIVLDIDDAKLIKIRKLEYDLYNIKLIPVKIKKEERKNEQ